MSRTPTKLSPESRLLQAAIDTVARNGYVSTTVEQLIAAAGASRSTFYDHFKDKDDCLRAAAERIVAPLVADIEERTAAQDPEATPKLVVTAVLDFAIQEQAQARVVFTELLAGGTGSMDIRDALLDRLAALIEQAWRAAGDRLPTVDMPARALVGGVFRLLSFYMRRGGKGPYDLEPAVLAWVEAYMRHHGRAEWQDDAIEARGPRTDDAVSPALPPPQLPRGRHGLAANEIAHIHRERLLHATAKCVYEKGYAAATVSQIVKEAAISRSVFYEQFPDKRAAVMAAMQLTLGASMSRCAEAFFKTSEWPSQLWAGARALSDYYRAAPSFVYLSFVEGYAVGSAAVQLIEESMMAFTYLLEPAYQLRPEDPTLERQAFSRIIACATFELAYREVRNRQPGAFVHLLPRLAYMNLAPFLGAERASEFIHRAMSEPDPQEVDPQDAS